MRWKRQLVHVGNEVADSLAAVRKPPLVERAEAEGVVCAPELGALVHVLAAGRGRARVATTMPALAPWLASALPPGVPLYVAGAVGAALARDPDVHLCGTPAEEAPFDLLVTEGGEIAPLLVPSGLALVIGAAPVEPGLVSAELALPGGETVWLAARVR
jgi:hypothetical protein